MPTYENAISEAACLLSDGAHAEYERGICELLARMFALCECDTEAGAAVAYADIREMNMQREMERSQK